MSYKISLLILVIIGFLPFKSAHAQSVITPIQHMEGGEVITDMGFDYTFGYNFTSEVNGHITSLGGFFNGVKQVSLWNKETGQKLASTPVSSNNQWQYVDISPVFIEAGKTYAVSAYLAGSGASYHSYPRIPDSAPLHILNTCYAQEDNRPDEIIDDPSLNLLLGLVDVGFAPSPDIMDVYREIRQSGPETYQVQLQVFVNADINLNAYIISEQYPAGWEVTEVSHGGTYESPNRKAQGLIEWLGSSINNSPLSMMNTTLTYTIKKTNNSTLFNGSWVTLNPVGSGNSRGEKF